MQLFLLSNNVRHQHTLAIHSLWRKIQVGNIKMSNPIRTIPFYCNLLAICSLKQVAINNYNILTNEMTEENQLRK